MAQTFWLKFNCIYLLVTGSDSINRDVHMQKGFVLFFSLVK